MSEITCSASKNQQVVVAVTRSIKAGCEVSYEQWVKKIAAIASTFDGYLGANVHRPAKGARHYTTVYRFDNHVHAAAWQASPEHAELVEEIQDWVEDETKRQVMSGLEVWFDAPDFPQKTPTKWKMALVLFLVVYVLVNLFSAIISTLLGDAPRLVQMAFVIGIQVLLMTYYLMPRINVWLQKWLFK